MIFPKSANLLDFFVQCGMFTVTVVIVVVVVVECKIVCNGYILLV